MVIKKEISNLKVQIETFKIKGFEIPIERRSCFRLIKDGKVIEESYSQLELEINLLKAILPFKGWIIEEYKLFKEFPFFVVLNKDIPEFISLDYPDVVIYIIKRLNEIKK